MEQIKPGEMAPDFDLPGDSGQRISLSAHRGSIVVLFFYPKDNTSGCTTEAIDFTALKSEFDAAGAVLIGLSPDSPKSHDKFKSKHQLDVKLASDEEKDVLGAYGVWVEKSMYGRKYMGVERTTLLIDRDGKIARIWNKVKVAGHAREVLDAARELNK
jgi:peroxiredoxin Q/BCP